MKSEDQEFIGKARARQAAEIEIGTAGISGGRLFEPWKEAYPGDPVLVRKLSREPSYWLVPVIIRGRTAGFIRVLGDGRIIHTGVFYQDPDRMEDLPSTVTGIEASEAQRLAAPKISPEKGDSASAPVFVHDGPPGREAWLIEVTRNSTPSRWIFVTPRFIYERAAGEMLDETVE